MIALLLDRDGTLMEDVGYPNDPDTVRLLPGAAETIRRWHDQFDVWPAIVSNQSGISRGLISLEQYQAVHERFTELFRQASGLTLPAYYCLHGIDDDCDCRKPKPGLLRQAISQFGQKPESILMIGDKPSDVAAGIAIGAKTVWLSFGRDYPNQELQPNLIIRDWSESIPIEKLFAKGND